MNAMSTVRFGLGVGAAGIKRCDPRDCGHGFESMLEG